MYTDLLRVTLGMLLQSTQEEVLIGLQSFLVTCL